MKFEPILLLFDLALLQTLLLLLRHLLHEDDKLSPAMAFNFNSRKGGSETYPLGPCSSSQRQRACQSPVMRLQNHCKGVWEVVALWHLKLLSVVRCIEEISTGQVEQASMTVVVPLFQLLHRTLHKDLVILPGDRLRAPLRRDDCLIVLEQTAEQTEGKRGRRGGDGGGGGVEEKKRRRKMQEGEREGEGEEKEESRRRAGRDGGLEE
eukprot:417543-Hanusia_phi.AAC.1